MISLFRRIRQKLIASGSLTKYLLYAVGEILLVVIGILIALQVNNWNEQRREQAIADDVRAGILSDLQKDLITIDAALEQNNRMIGLFDSLQVKITHPDVTKEGVIDALKNDFSPYTGGFDGFSDNTYRSSSASGTISLLNQAKRELLYNYYLMQSVTSESLLNYELQYLSTISEFNEDFPLSEPFLPFNSGPVYDEKWANPDFEKLTSKFNKAGTTQRNYFRIRNNNLSEIRPLTLKLIDLLEDSR